jgi:hypothetical protein
MSKIIPLPSEQIRIKTKPHLDIWERIWLEKEKAKKVKKE